MRRSDREITELEQITAILDCCKVFRVAMSVNDTPYIVPLNLGFERTEKGFVFFFHCAKEGKKLDMLRKNPRVCFEADCAHELTAGETACAYGYNYRSVIGSGTASEITDAAEKARALSLLMKRQTGKNFVFTDAQANSVSVWKIEADELTAKGRG